MTNQLKVCKEYKKFCHKYGLKKRNEKVLDLFYRLNDLGFYDELRDYCSAHNLPVCDSSAVAILKTEMPEVIAERKRGESLKKYVN